MNCTLEAEFSLVDSHSDVGESFYALVTRLGKVDDDPDAMVQARAAAERALAVDEAERVEKALAALDDDLLATYCTSELETKKRPRAKKVRTNR